MPLGMSIAAFLTLWWVVLFAVLPWGIQSHAEAGIEVHDGGAPGAPVNPKLKEKFLITTLVTAILFAILWLVVRFHVVELPPLAAR